MIESWNDDHTGWALFSDDETMRYRLGRSLDGRPLIVHDGIIESDAIATFLMLNPSVASAFINDPTIKRGIGFGAAWGCDVYQAVNIHPLRSTNPDGLYSWTRSLSGVAWDELQRANLEQIRLACVGAKRVVAAWGKHGAHLLQGKAVREFCAASGIRLYHLGLNQDGSPKHPLYIKGGTEPQEWALS